MAPGPVSAAAGVGVGVGTGVGVLHVHSDYSHDGHDSLEEIRSWALDHGVQFVGLSDHAEDFSADRFEEFVVQCRAQSDERVTLIPGLEFRFAGLSGLHLLAIGLRSWISPSTPSEFTRLAPAVSALTVLAHPGLARYRIPDTVRQHIGAVEIWNGAYNTRYLPDPVAMRMVRDWRRERAGVLATAGLDQHDRRNDRELRVALLPGAGEPLAALAAGRFINRGRTLSIGATGGWSTIQLASLTLARGVFDFVERIQDRTVRWWRRTRGRQATRV